MLRIRTALVTVICMIVLIGSQSRAATDVLITSGSVWAYLDDGSNQGTSWREPEFDDSAWSSGTAQLGYGDGDESTIVSFGPNSGDKHITTYFRRSFNVVDPSVYQTIIIELLRDDGAVIYVNGVEVVRSNMPDDPINSETTSAFIAQSAGEDTFFRYSVPSTVLMSGTNVIAAEVHQADPTSSDLSFDLQCIATSQLVRDLVPFGSVWKYLDEGSDQGTGWSAPGFDDSTWSEGLAELGYGDGDESTTVSYGSDPLNRYITTYFRHEFSVADPGLFNVLALGIRRDDGAVVHLNGSEVFRSNMPPGVIDSTTLASATIGGASESVFVETTIPAGALAAGLNVLAVEVHQAAVDSSDISLDLYLRGIDQLGDPSVIRGPYLQIGTSESVIVRWRTDLPTDSRVMLGADPGNLTTVVDDPVVTTEHIVTVGGLAADTQYYYSIGSSSQVLAGADSAHVFTTSPEVGVRRPVRVWVLGDSGTANANARAVRDSFYAFNGGPTPDLWLMLGDNAYADGTDDEYQAAVFGTYPETLQRSVLWPTLGNHDAHSADSPSQSGVYYEIFTLPTNGEAGGLPSGTEAYYSFDYANIHFICLDSHDTNRSPTGAMMQWLAADVGDTTQDWVIAFWHHPPYSKGSHDSDTTSGADARLADMRENALPILEAAGVDLVLAGHSHSYERSFLLDGHYGQSTTLQPSMILDNGDGRSAGDGAYEKATLGTGPHEGAVYIVAGSSGKISGGTLDHPAMYLSLNVLGSLVIDVDGARLDATFLDDAGIIEDTFSIIKMTPPEPCSGDADGDLDVDFVDLNIVLGNFGTAGPPGDINSDNSVDVLDLNLVIGNFGCGI